MREIKPGRKLAEITGLKGWRSLATLVHLPSRHLHFNRANTVARGQPCGGSVGRFIADVGDCETEE
jgi:hypothetical protein